VKTTLKLKIIGSFVLATLVTTALGLFGARTFSTSSENSDASTRQSLDQVQQVTDIELAFLMTVYYTDGTFKSVDVLDNFKDLAIEQYLAAMEDTTTKLVAFEDAPMSSAARDLYDQALDHTSYLNQASNSLLDTDLVVPNPAVAAPISSDMVPQIEDRQAQQREVLGNLRAQVQADAWSARATVTADNERAQRMLLIAAVVASATLLAAGIWLSGRLVRRLRATVKVLHRVADGDLTARFDDTGTDEVGEIATALNSSVSTIQEVVCQLESDADTLARLAQLSLSRERAISSGTAGAIVSDSFDCNAEVAEMAENLNNMIRVFVVDDSELAGSDA
jgi:methyl-accepting chemotaxis protein